MSSINSRPPEKIPPLNEDPPKVHSGHEAPHPLPMNPPIHLNHSDLTTFRNLMHIAEQNGRVEAQNADAADRAKVHNKAMKECLERAMQDDTEGVGQLSPTTLHAVNLVAKGIPT